MRRRAPILIALVAVVFGIVVMHSGLPSIAHRDHEAQHGAGPCSGDGCHDSPVEPLVASCLTAVLVFAAVALLRAPRVDGSTWSAASAEPRRPRPLDRPPPSVGTARSCVLRC